MRAAMVWAANLLIYSGLAAHGFSIDHRHMLGFSLICAVISIAFLLEGYTEQAISLYEDTETFRVYSEVLGVLFLYIGVWGIFSAIF